MGTAKIGRNGNERYRLYFKVELPSIAVESVTNVSFYHCLNTSSSNTWNLTITEEKSDLQEQYAAIADGDELVADLNYNFCNEDSDQTLADYIKNNLGSTVYIGAYSNQESSDGSATIVTFRIFIDYDDTPLELNITAKNKMDSYEGGDIKVGVNEDATSKTSPFTFSAQENNTVNLGAVENQSYNNYNWIWNDTEAPLEKSKWEQFDGQTYIYKTGSQNYNFSAAGSDNGSDYIANLRKVCNYTVSNQFSGSTTGQGVIVNGQTFQSPHTTPVVEQNTITIEAPEIRDINGIRFLFDKWSDNNENPLRIITVSQHDNMQAIYWGYPKFMEQDGRNLHFNTFNPRNPNEYIKLYWNEHPNSDVTKYYVYRHDTKGEQLIGITNRGTCTYTDTKYFVRTSTNGDTEVYYDVRAYYAPDGTLSEIDMMSAYGDLAQGSADKELAENETNGALTVTEYAISNFPNPFNPTTSINYQLPQAGHVTIKVYDMLGKEVTELVNETKEAGIYSAEFNGNNLSSGVYVYTIQVKAANEKSKGYVMSKKMLLMK